MVRVFLSVALLASVACAGEPDLGESQPFPVVEMDPNDALQHVNGWTYGWARVFSGSFGSGICDFCATLRHGNLVSVTVDDCSFVGAVVGDGCMCLVRTLGEVTNQTPAECWCEVTQAEESDDPDCADAEWPATPGSGTGGWEQWN